MLVVNVAKKTSLTCFVRIEALSVLSRSISIICFQLAIKLLELSACSGCDDMMREKERKKKRKYEAVGRTFENRKEDKDAGCTHEYGVVV